MNQNLGDDTDAICDGPYSCKDCNTARICKPTAENAVFKVVQEIPCPKERPFCDFDSGTCVENAPGNCGGSDDFICMGNGRYPDKDCKKFHACINLEAKSFECAIDGHSYNPKTQTCEPGIPCGTFDCASNEVRKAPHDQHPGYFAYCKLDSQGPLVVDSCPPQYTLDPSSQLCAPDCKADGIIADHEDCHYYYKCSLITIKKGISYATSQRLRCPDGQAYSPVEFLCVDQTRVDTCSKKK